jgi:RNA polymerase sigma-70 factor (ECF subfamily)
MRASIAEFDDRRLIELIVAGHTEWFSVLMDRHVAAVRRVAGAIIGNASDVEDLVQETFLKAWRGLPKFRFDANFRTWITSVAVNEALMAYRRRRCRPFCVDTIAVESLGSSNDFQERALARSEARRKVHNAIARLPEKYRDVLILCELQEMSGREAACRLNSSLSAVKTRLLRARRMLSTAVQKQAA